MEMPKWWKALKNTGECQRDDLILEAADLMKEMAEALRMVVTGYEYHDEKECKVYGCKEALAVLKKFKDWK